MSAKLQTRSERSNELADRILEILRPQLNGPDGELLITEAQRAQLRAAIAQYTAELRGE